MKRKFIILAALVLLASTLVSGQEEITIRIKEGMPMIPVALPDFQFTEASLPNNEIKSLIYETLWRDLEYSRVFKLVPREHYSYISRFDANAINFKDWASIQANILISGQLEMTADERIIFSLKVYEVNSARFIFGRNYGGKKDLGRMIAHRVADEMMKHFGEKPLFTSKIVYVFESGKDRDIYIMDYDGSRPTRITYSNALDMLPSWSADNEKILYTSYRNLSPELFMFDIYTGKTELLSSGGSNYAADWSPVADQIVFTSSKNGNAEIFLKDMKTGKEKQLTFNPAIDTTPCWSPNGREIAFTSQRSGTPQIYIMDAEGSNIRRITTEGSYHDSSTWSPDGMRLAFVSRIENRFDIYVFNLKSNEISKLTENAGRNENPSWSPDGRHLVFSSNRSGKYQLYLMDYDGRNIRQITSAGENKMPKWQKLYK
ncbi:MAG: Tol-Pal system beta propeller repeat protein TolB [Candidatus Aminicenantes bacterium]|nr:Tol-Pal system beta propeller repeat protein TolB [Candidatus Aminicenantes bacterium]